MAQIGLLFDCREEVERIAHFYEALCALAQKDRAVDLFSMALLLQVNFHFFGMNMSQLDPALRTVSRLCGLPPVSALGHDVSAALSQINSVSFTTVCIQGESCIVRGGKVKQLCPCITHSIYK